ncbi:hypothetical protein e1004f01.tmp0141 [Eimeria tenella]|uniref:Uncharacterized protein n=1 Tax=Eimeria tenella TaxID=5802 RepID=C8TE28_EIMTE|nr:hypothetical protein e1004f01.tmp0141 [Eimeria tenella]
MKGENKNIRRAIQVRTQKSAAESITPRFRAMSSTQRLESRRHRGALLNTRETWRSFYHKLNVWIQTGTIDHADAPYLLKSEALMQQSGNNTVALHHHPAYDASSATEGVSHSPLHEHCRIVSLQMLWKSPPCTAIVQRVLLDNSEESPSLFHIMSVFGLCSRIMRPEWKLDELSPNIYSLKLHEEIPLAHYRLSPQATELGRYLTLAYDPSQPISAALLIAQTHQLPISQEIASVRAFMHTVSFWWSGDYDDERSKHLTGLVPMTNDGLFKAPPSKTFLGAQQSATSNLNFYIHPVFQDGATVKYVSYNCQTVPSPAERRTSAQKRSTAALFTALHHVTTDYESCSAKGLFPKLYNMPRGRHVLHIGFGICLPDEHLTFLHATDKLRLPLYFSIEKL